MSKGMKKIYGLSDNEITQLKSDYKKALNTAYAVFGNDAFRKRYNKNDNRKPINKALFDSLSVSFAKLSDVQCQQLIGRKELFRDKLIALHNNSDGKFLRALTQGTALKANVIQRFSDIERIIKETLQEV
jgi:DNA polymerase III delta subunit